MSKISLTSEQYLKQLNFLFYGLMIAPFIYSPIAVYIKESGTFGTQSENVASFNIWVPGLCLILVVASVINYSKKIKQIAQEEHFEVKVIRFRSLFLMTLGILEVALVCCFISYCLTLSFYFVLYCILVLLAFIYRRPRIQDLVKDLKLNGTEESRLNDPTDFIIP